MAPRRRYHNIAFKTRFWLIPAVNPTTRKRIMGFGFTTRKSSPQPWTVGSFPGPPMLVTNVPTYSVASPCYSYSPQLASPMIVPVPVSPPVQPIPMTVPMQVAFQSPMVQMPPPTTTYTVFQPVPSVPSPVIHAPVTMHPANPSPIRAPQPRHPQPTGDTGNALMLVQTPSPQQAPQSSPNINISLHLLTPQQQPMQLHAVAQNQSVPSPFFTALED